jgi:hypothetical protein
MNEKKLERAYAVSKVLYRMWIRSMLKEAIDDPQRDWDDVLMDVADRVFDYKEN